MHPFFETRARQIFTPDFNEYLRKWIPLGILIGVVCGLGAIVFQTLLTLVWDISYSGFLPWFVILFVPALGGLLAGVIMERYAPETAGAGTDNVIDSLHHRGGEIRPRVAPVKIVASALTMGSGGSGGSEGPLSQIGGSLASYLGTRLKLRKQDMHIFVISGMAAGLSAVFRAPLGAAIFALEVPYKNDFESRAVVPSIISSTVSYLMGVPLYGVNPVFSIPTDSMNFTMATLPFVLLIGVGAGIVGILFASSFQLVRAGFQKFESPLWVKTAIGGLAVGIIGLALPEILGLSRGTTQSILSGTTYSAAFLFALLVGKIIATSFTVGSGGSAGVFSLTALIGAATSALFVSFFNLSDGALFIAVGMGAMTAGITKTPVASTILITEMVGGTIILIPIMIASVISYVITGNFTIFEKQIVRRGFSLDVSDLGRVKVSRVMTKKVITIPTGATLADAYKIAVSNPHYAYPVVFDGDRIIGLAHRDDILDAYRKIPDGSVMNVLQTHYEPMSAEEDCLAAFDLMNSKNISRMIVVDPKDKARVVGLLNRIDVLNYLDHTDRGRAEGETSAEQVGAERILGTRSLEEQSA